LRLATARGSFTISRLPFTNWPRCWLSFTGRREVRRFEYRGSRQACDSPTAHPNKPMHPTADTLIVMLQQSPCAASDAGR
jgi:hypothetical protein